MDKKMEVRGKSWKREREERGRKLKTIAPNNNTVDFTEPEETKSAVENSTEEGNAQSESIIPEKIEEVETLIEVPAETLEETAKQVLETEQKQQLNTYIEEMKERLQAKIELRESNIKLASERPEEEFFSKLDSNLKKNTAFVKRLRNMTEVQKDSLIKDMKSLNLTKYISEAAAAIVDAKLKISDVSTAVQVCSTLHQRYADFTPQLLENWQKVLPLKKDEKIMNPSKIRVDLRFYAELITCGVFTLKEGLPLLGNLLTVLTSTDKEDHNNLNILLSFCKHCGEDYASIVPSNIRSFAEQYEIELPCSTLLPPDRQRGLKTLLKDYYLSLVRHVMRDHKNLHNMERQNIQTLQTKGELASERREKFEAAQTTFQKLWASTQQFADLLNEEIPDLPKDELTSPDADTMSLDIHNRFRDGDIEGSNSLWEDDDTRCFYESLPDLKASIPNILFKDSAQTLISSLPGSELAEKALEEELNKLDLEDLQEEENQKDMEEVEEPESILGNTDQDEMSKSIQGVDDKEPLKETEGELDFEIDLTAKLLQETEEPEEETLGQETTSAAPSNKALLEGFLSTMLQCVNREMIDNSAIDFCMNLNTKPNRRKLVKALFLVPRTRLDLLPFYARFVAILAPCMPDVANDLVAMIKQDFKFHIKKKDQINIESKIKSVRFIGELVKFGIYPKNEALFCLKMLLFDFSHHHIEMACNLLETCGRFLFRSPESHQRTKVYLDQMMRKKSVMAIDSRYTTMVENAFYYCNPPEAPSMVRVERPPLHNYIRKLLYKELSKNNTEKILRQMRKLDWDTPEENAYTTKCLTNIWNVKYYNIRCVANLLAGLVANQETVGPQVVDGVLEDIRLGMEMNLPKYNQRRVSMVRYLGELYNYRMVESAVIFKVLYACITFGVNYDGSYSELDTPDNLFRLRLVCTLLDTCGQYFNNGSSKKKLDCFLIFFQRYYMQKKCHDLFVNNFPFPVTVSLMVKETLTTLRPKMKLCENLEQADKMVENLLEEFKPKLVEVFSLFGKSDEELENSDKAKDDSLGPIQEDAEGEDDDYLGSEQEDADLLSGSQSQPIDEEDEEDKTGEEVGASFSDEEGGDRGRRTQQDDAEGQTQGAEEEEVGLLVPAPKLVQCQEDDDFMTAFDKMLTESIMHRTQEPVKPQVDIVIPMNVKGGPGKFMDPSKNITGFTGTLPDMAQSPVYGPALGDDTQTKNPKQSYEKPTINFLLMTRKGNKQQFKSLEVPTTSELAQNLRDREKAERAEKEQVKKLILNINERQEEEDYQEMLAAQQRPVVVNFNRDRRHRYQHPKGAPDADLIFGNK